MLLISGIIRMCLHLRHFITYQLSRWSYIMYFYYILIEMEHHLYCYISNWVVMKCCRYERVRISPLINNNNVIFKWSVRSSHLEMRHKQYVGATTSLLVRHRYFLTFLFSSENTQNISTSRNDISIMFFHSDDVQLPQPQLLNFCYIFNLSDNIFKHIKVLD